MPRRYAGMEDPGSAAGQIELFGKLSILVVSMPVVRALLETMGGLLSDEWKEPMRPSADRMDIYGSFCFSIGSHGSGFL
ncbi:MAG: stage III sporulation AC/AD family protein [Lachnospiraceae bacterium]